MTPTIAPKSRLVLPLLLLPLLASGCVRRSTHEAALAAARDEYVALQERSDEREAELQREIESIEREKARVEAELRERIETLERDQRMLESLRSQANDRFNQARTEIERLETLLNRQGSEYQALQERLDQLSAIEREIRERNRIYEETLGRFRSLIDGGRVSVNIVRGRMVIQLPQDILFASGSATVGAEGRRTLAEVGGVLAELADREFQVEGHTDNVPISTERFPSNWELSSARALSVVRVLIDAGVPPDNISGAGFGEHRPVASNAEAEGRRRNRRIEIVMLPNLDVIATTQLPG